MNVMKIIYTSAEVKLSFMGEKVRVKYIVISVIFLWIWGCRGEPLTPQAWFSLQFRQMYALSLFADISFSMLLGFGYFIVFCDA
jgi:hypothetical protein